MMGKASSGAQLPCWCTTCNLYSVI